MTFLPTFIGLFFALALSLNIVAHPGKQDTQGGHADKKTGQYHCHSRKCFQQHQQSADALKEARQEQRPYSLMYNRDDWPHWSDTDNDCQKTRAEVLIASSKKPVTFWKNNPCLHVLSGEWYDPYTNKTFTLSNQLDIDHRIALAEAHRYGGANWSTAEKERFANDPLNLVAVQSEANKNKSDHPAFEWMPKHLGYWCNYIKAREAVVQKYQLRFPDKELQFNSTIKQQYCPRN